MGPEPKDRAGIFFLARGRPFVFLAGAGHVYLTMGAPSFVSLFTLFCARIHTQVSPGFDQGFTKVDAKRAARAAGSC